MADIITTNATKRQLYHKTSSGPVPQLIASSADIVYFDNTTAQLEGTPSTAQAALEKIADLAKTGGVTSVNDKKGDVTITAAVSGSGDAVTGITVTVPEDPDEQGIVIQYTKGGSFAKLGSANTFSQKQTFSNGFESTKSVTVAGLTSSTGLTVNGGGSSATYGATSILRGQSTVITLPSSQGTLALVSDVENQISTALSGYVISKTYANYSDFVEAVNSFDNDDLKVSSNVYIVTLNVPDMWVSSVNATYQRYTYTTDAAIITALDSTSGLTVGYYTFRKLESTKVNLTNYVTTNTAQTISGHKTFTGNVTFTKTGGGTATVAGPASGSVSISMPSYSGTLALLDSASQVFTAEQTFHKGIVVGDGTSSTAQSLIFIAQGKGQSTLQMNSSVTGDQTYYLPATGGTLATTAYIDAEIGDIDFSDYATKDALKNGTLEVKFKTPGSINVGVISGPNHNGNSISGSTTLSINSGNNSAASITLGDSGIGIDGFYTAVQFNSKGIAIAGAHTVAWGTSATLPDYLVEGGLYFREV